MKSDLEKRFEVALNKLCEETEDFLGYRAIRFHQMIEREGAVGAVRKLIHSFDTTSGYVALLKENKLELTVEFFVAENPEWHALFDAKDIRMAKEKIKRGK